MKRRDLILATVVVNACLLIVLFITALKPHANVEYKEGYGQQFDAKKSTSVDQTVTYKPPSVDQVDHILSQYVEKSDVSLPQRKLDVTDNELKKLHPEPPKEKIVSVKPQEIETKVPAQTHLVQFTVKQGDVLEKIAKLNGTSVEEIMDLNSLPDTRLKVGQVLFIPQGGSKTPKKENTRPKPLQIEEAYYVVEAGDNPWTIAAKNHIKVKELLVLNDLNEERARKLKPGDKLRIR